MTRTLFHKICSILLGALLAIASSYVPSLAADDGDLQTLEMFYDRNDLVVSATRSPKPISQTAENITVITAADIEMMGAHTLPEVLNNVPGIQISDRGGLGTFTDFSIQGADNFHILVLLDGVTLNFLGAALADIAPIPVQNVERIEIIKGAGSSSWGSAMGGVINIITKSPLDDRRIGGTLSFSAGERGTRDSLGEAAGTVGSIGYYLFADNLVSGGFRPHTTLDLNNLYAKLRWALPDRGSIQYTLAYTRQTVGEGQVAAFNITLKDQKKNFLSTLSLYYPFNDNTDIEFSLHTTSKRFDSLANELDTGAPILPDIITHEKTLGGSAKMSWRKGSNSLAMGADYDNVDYDDGTLKLKSDKWGLFLNDTLTIRDFAVTPGIRFDRTNQVGDFLSPSLGVAWNLNDQSTLRFYGGRGYSLPFLNASEQSKVITFQAGAETTQLPHLWLKATLFWNRLSDVQAFDSDGNRILAKQRKQGIEAEARTVPLFNSSLSAGYTFVDAKNRDTGEVLLNIPRQIVKLGLNYDDKLSLRGTLLGRYVWWNGSPGNATKDKAIIWDLNLAKKVYSIRDNAVELFFSAHNIFNGAQFNSDLGFENARRWLEGGIRFDF